MSKKITIMQSFRKIVEAIKIWVDNKSTVVYQPEPPENTNVLWVDIDDNTPGDPSFYDHNSLTNRDINNQHPISAITGLQEELDSVVKTINGKAPINGNIEISESEPIEVTTEFGLVSSKGKAADAYAVGMIKLADLHEDNEHQTVTINDKKNWNAKNSLRLDKTLKNPGEAAEAAAVGTRLENLKTSELVNDAHFVMNDDIPKIPAWALKETKPSYTAAEVGADDRGIAVTLMENHNNPKTLSHKDIRSELDKKINSNSIVNDLTTGGTQVPLSAEQGKNLKSQIDGIKVPTQLSELASDESHRTVTDAEKLKWNSSKGVELDATLEDPLKAAQAKVVGDKFKALKIPTKTSELTNDSGFATDVPAWVFDQLEKPTYTDVGADQAGTASSTVQTHNASKTSHKDIRDKINTVETDVKSRIKSINGHTADPETGNIVIDTGSKIDIVEDFESETSKGKAADAFAVGTRLKEYAKTTEIPTVPEWVQQQPNKPTASDIGADAKGTAQSLINAHNSSSEAHQDIRTALAGKLTTDDIVNNLTSTLTNKALSAKQGKELSDKLNGLNLSIIPGTEKARTVTDQEKATWNAKTSVVVDATVTNPGQAADAAAVKELLSGKQDAGDYLIDSDLTSIREDISALQQKITYGTELPVGGKNGDIYIMYEA